MHTFMIAATSADGFIAPIRTQRSFDWTSQEDKNFYVSKIKQAGTVIMGSTTFHTFTKFPRGLTYYVYTREKAKFINPKPEVITAIPTDAAPHELLRELARTGTQEVAVCGGSSVYSLFLEAGAIDTIYLTVEPVLFGDGVKLLRDDLETRLELVSTSKMGDQSLLLEYRVIKP